MKQRNLKLICVLALALLAGCAGSKSHINALNSDYPVSFSPAIRDTDGSILMDDSLTQVGDFKYKYRTCRMCWRAIPLSKHQFDLSGEINRQVSESGGEGIVNLNIIEIQNWWTCYASFITLGLFPSYNDVEIKGMIVKRAEQTP